MHDRNFHIQIGIEMRSLQLQSNVDRTLRYVGRWWACPIFTVSTDGRNGLAPG